MAFPFDPANARVRVSTTSGGTYASIGKVRTSNYTEGQEGRVRTKYLGGQVVRPGDNTLGGTMTVLYDSGDTTGQALLVTAKRAGTSLFFQFCPEGTATGAKVQQFEANVTEISNPFDADAETLERSFTLEGVDTVPTEITLA
jgi:hypothetical protein